MWWNGTGWDHATQLARRVPCLVARRRVHSQLDGDESAKDCGWRRLRTGFRAPWRVAHRGRSLGLSCLLLALFATEESASSQA
jgi:hypothetical protein